MVDPHLEALRGVARGLVRSPHAAEDLFQDTCLRAYVGFAGWRGDNPRAWLVAIMMNGLRMEIRKARSRPIEDLGENLDAPSAGASVEDSAIAAADRRHIVEMLGVLPESARQSVVLMDLGGLTAQEVANLLGCPRGTVLARVHRARRQMAQAIESRVGAL